MIDPVVIVPYVLACLLFAVIPGPSVSVFGGVWLALQKRA